MIKKKDYFEQVRMFGGVAKIPISNTFSELVEMDFSDYGDSATFLRIRDTFSRFFCDCVFRDEKERRTSRGNGKGDSDFELVSCVCGRLKSWWKAEIPGSSERRFVNFVLLET